MGDNILIFPEGTRTVPEQPIKMHRGLGNLALAINADIQTLLMSCTPLTLTKRSKWYEIPHKKVTLKLRVGLFFSNKDYQDERPRSIRVRALMREIQHYYNRYLS